MGHSWGRISEVRIEAGGQLQAFVACPPEIIPRAGQYLLASDLDDPEAVLGVSLFNTQNSAEGFWAAPPIPHSWRPGAALDLTGPLGHGFNLPRETQRLGLVALGETVARLMPLVQEAGHTQRAMTLFTDLPVRSLPASLEMYPLSSLAEALDWPDFMVIDLPLERLPELSTLLGLAEGRRLPFPAQVLVTTAMPCAGFARCGACAVPARRGWKLVCEDGPVFDLSILKW